MSKAKKGKNEISSLVLHRRPIRTLSLFFSYITKTLGGLMAQAARNQMVRFVIASTSVFVAALYFMAHLYHLAIHYSRLLRDGRRSQFNLEWGIYQHRS